MPESNESKTLLGVTKRLDALIAILLDKPNSEATVTATEKVKKLSEAGLAPADIATILGKPLNQITALMSSLRKRPAKAKTHGK